MSELIDREPLLKKWGDGCWCQDDCHGDCLECAFPGAVDDLKTAPTIDAVPVEIIKHYKEMWKSRAEGGHFSDRMANGLMAQAAEIILNYQMRDIKKRSEALNHGKEI